MFRRTMKTIFFRRKVTRTRWSRCGPCRMSMSNEYVRCDSAADVALVICQVQTGTPLSLCQVLRQTVSYAPSPPDGRNFQELTTASTFPVWQGGGMYIHGSAQVTVTRSNIYSNAFYVLLSQYLIKYLAVSNTVVSCKAT